MHLTLNLHKQSRLATAMEYTQRVMLAGLGLLSQVCSSYMHYNIQMERSRAVSLNICWGEEFWMILYQHEHCAENNGENQTRTFCEAFINADPL